MLEFKIPVIDLLTDWHSLFVLTLVLCELFMLMPTLYKSISFFILALSFSWSRSFLNSCFDYSFNLYCVISSKVLGYLNHNFSHWSVSSNSFVCQFFCGCIGKLPSLSSNIYCIQLCFFFQCYCQFFPSILPHSPQILFLCPPIFNYYYQNMFDQDNLSPLKPVC